MVEGVWNHLKRGVLANRGDDTVEALSDSPADASANPKRPAVALPRPGSDRAGAMTEPVNPGLTKVLKSQGLASSILPCRPSGDRAHPRRLGEENARCVEWQQSWPRCSRRG